MEELIREDERANGIVMDTLIDIPRGKLLEDVKSFPGCVLELKDVQARKQDFSNHRLNHSVAKHKQKSLPAPQDSRLAGEVVGVVSRRVRTGGD